MLVHLCFLTSALVPKIGTSDKLRFCVRGSAFSRAGSAFFPRWYRPSLQQICVSGGFCTFFIHLV